MTDEGRETWGGVLIGGASRRMGEPKQLLRHRGATLLELAVAALAPHVAGVAILGAGAVPAGVASLARLADAELPPPVNAEPATPPLGSHAGAGPLAGILAALRWKPEATWIIAACDLPEIAPEAVAWLLAQRRPDRRAVLPRPRSDGPVHPLFALYEPAARSLLEDLAATGGRAPRLVTGHPQVAVVAPPAHLARCWRGVSTRADLAALSIRADPVR